MEFELQHVSPALGEVASTRPSKIISLSLQGEESTWPQAGCWGPSLPVPDHRQAVRILSPERVLGCLGEHHAMGRVTAPLKLPKLSPNPSSSGSGPFLAWPLRGQTSHWSSCHPHQLVHVPLTSLEQRQQGEQGKGLPRGCWLQGPGGR